MVALVFNLEGKIPTQWDKNVEILCPGLDSGEKFHTHALNGSGHVMTVISFPLGNLIGQKLLKTTYEQNNSKNRTWL
jgi:hypothetical protein